jgi:hypothetical protein
MDDDEKGRAELQRQAMAEYEKYKAYVQSVAEKSDGQETIQNKTAAHAGIIIAALFAKARKEVLAMSGCLNKTAYGNDDVIRNAIEFLRRDGVVMKIVVDEAVTSANNKFLAALRDANVLGGVQLHHANVRQPFHLMLVDNSHYRYQEDTDTCEAIAQFGMSDLGALTASFQKSLGESTPYQP